MGLPAISSVCGAMMLVIPDVAGITIFSPKLDHLYNPVRAVQFCQELINIYQFHKYDNVGPDVRSLTSKIDPILKKSFTANELGIQLLFASAYGDLVFLRRAYLRQASLLAHSSNDRSDHFWIEGAQLLLNEYLQPNLSENEGNCP